MLRSQVVSLPYAEHPWKLLHSHERTTCVCVVDRGGLLYSARTSHLFVPFGFCRYLACVFSVSVDLHTSDLLPRKEGRRLESRSEIIENPFRIHGEGRQWPAKSIELAEKRRLKHRQQSSREAHFLPCESPTIVEPTESWLLGSVEVC